MSKINICSLRNLGSLNRSWLKLWSVDTNRQRKAFQTINKAIHNLPEFKISLSKFWLFMWNKEYVRALSKNQHLLTINHYECILLLKEVTFKVESGPCKKWFQIDYWKLLSDWLHWNRNLKNLKGLINSEYNFDK